MGASVSEGLLSARTQKRLSPQKTEKPQKRGERPAARGTRMPRRGREKKEILLAKMKKFYFFLHMSKIFCTLGKLPAAE